MSEVLNVSTCKPMEERCFDRSGLETMIQLQIVLIILLANLLQNATMPKCELRICVLLEVKLTP